MKRPSHCIFSLLLVPALLLIGCGGSDQAKLSKVAPTPSPSAAATPEALVTFTPELLLSSAQTARFTVEIPPAGQVIQAQLDERVSTIVSLAMVVECANAETRKELKGKVPEMREMIKQYLSIQKAEFVRSTAGQMNIKEELLFRIKQHLTHQAVKELYFTQYAIQLGAN